MDDRAEKEGLFVGRYAINPVNGRRVPIYTANFVLADYGTGAVMAVPAHDQRDFEFAEKYDIAKRLVIQPEGQTVDVSEMAEAYVGGGTLCNSGAHDGIDNESGKAAIVAELESLSRGKATINFRLRDWGISRQRYWGAPIPVVYCAECGMQPVPSDELPVRLPEDVVLDGQGGSPLARHEGFWSTKCPSCGGAARRETDTFDTFMESSWYFLRYCSPHFLGGMVDAQAAARFLPVDQYIGGIEHAVMHLLYARFYTKLLRDLGHVQVDEPFSNLLCQGMVCHETYRSTEGQWLYPTEVVFEGSGASRSAIRASDGSPVEIGRVEKMSKSKHNTVDPQTFIERYGADTIRLFCLFAAPPHKDLDWSEKGVEGCYRFLCRVWKLVQQRSELIRSAQEPHAIELDAGSAELRQRVHQTIDRVSRDVEERMQFNTAIAATMELLNSLVSFHARDGVPREFSAAEAAAFAEGVQVLLMLLSPFAPHISDELWQLIGGDGILENQPWPESDASIAAASTMTLVVQVKGKKRAEMVFSVQAEEEEIKAAALAHPNVQRFLGEQPPRMVKYIPGRLVAIVPGA